MLHALAGMLMVSFLCWVVFQIFSESWKELRRRYRDRHNWGSQLAQAFNNIRLPFQIMLVLIVLPLFTSGAILWIYELANA